MTSYEKGFLAGCLRAGISPRTAGRLFKQAQVGWADEGIMSPTFKESPVPVSQPKSRGIEITFPKPLSLDPAKPATTLHQFLSGVKYSKLEDIITPEMIAVHTNIPLAKVQAIMSQMPYSRLDSYTPEMLAELDAAGNKAIKAYQAEQEARKEVKKAPPTQPGQAQPQQPQATQQAQLKQQKHQKFLDLTKAVKKNQMKAFLRANKVPLLAGAGVLTAAMAALLVNRMRKRRRAKKPAEVQ